MLTQIKQTDTGSYLTYRIIDDNDKSVDLTGATVKFIMGTKSKSHIYADATIVNAPLGDVRYDFIDQDTLVSGNYISEFEVTFPNGKDKIYPSNGYLNINIQSNLNTDRPNIALDLIAKKQGDFEKKLDDILGLANIGLSYMNEYFWTTEEGQLTFSLPEGTTFDPDAVWVQVNVGGALINDTLVNFSSGDGFTLTVEPSQIPVGLRVVLRWTDTLVPTTFRVIDGGTF